MKRETVQEYLARGGKIQVLPPASVDGESHILKPQGQPMIAENDGKYAWIGGYRVRPKGGN